MALVPAGAAALGADACMPPPQSGPFTSKVDPKAQGCRTYYDVIKQPMWLDKVKQRLGTTARREYTHPAQFRDDMRLIWANCRIFNPEHSDVRRACRSRLGSSQVLLQQGAQEPCPVRLLAQPRRQQG